MSTSVASVVSHFPSAENGFTTTLASTISSGATTVPLNSVAGYTNGETAVFVVDPSDATKKQTFTGIIDTAGVQVTSVVWTAGTNQSHSGGATVVDYATATHISMVTKGLLVEHKQAGTHSAITADSVTVATGKITTTAVGKLEDAAIPLSTYRANTMFDHVASGGVWSGDAYGSTLAASMTAAVVYINGRRISISAVTARAFTASKDVYIDVLDNADGTGTLVYTDNTINAASPALAANSIRIGIIVTGAGNIASAASVNQGQETKLVPIASSIPYAVTDSLGNLICPRDPSRKILGFRRCVADIGTTSSTVSLVTPLRCPVIVPANRKVRIRFYGQFVGDTAGNYVVSSLWDGAVVSGTKLAEGSYLPSSGTGTTPGQMEAVQSPAAGSKSYDVGLKSNNNTNGVHVLGASDNPAIIVVELV
jgi:hypothetical protein